MFDYKVKYKVELYRRMYDISISAVLLKDLGVNTMNVKNPVRIIYLISLGRVVIAFLQLTYKKV